MSMKYVCAYLMSVLGGKEHPSKDDVTEVLKSVDIDPEMDILEQFMKGVDGKSAHQLIASGMSKLQNMPSGGGAVAAAKGPATDTVAAPEVKEAAKQEKEESEDESEDDMGFSLFD